VKVDKFENPVNKNKKGSKRKTRCEPLVQSMSDTVSTMMGFISAIDMFAILLLTFATTI
jgi:hypothetical protein